MTFSMSPAASGSYRGLAAVFGAVALSLALDESTVAGRWPGANREGCGARLRRFQRYRELRTIGTL